MNRRTFSKQTAGTLTALGLPKVNTGKSSPPQLAQDVIPGVPTNLSAISDVPPGGGSRSWELVILDAAPPHVTAGGGVAAADIDGNGKTELIVAADGALLWYRPSTCEKGVITLGKFAVGVALEDVDGGGRKEVFAGKKIGEKQGQEYWSLRGYKPGTNLQDSWTEFVLDSETAGHPHDLVFADVDGDGRRELVANAMYCAEPGLYVYKAPSSLANPWKKQTMQTGISAEGTAAGDLDGDGKEEIVSGPYWYSAPSAGAFSGQLWTTHSLAPGYREFCRAVIIDVNGDGQLDVVLVEDEYPDGRLAWFENRLASGNSWLAHPIDDPLNFSHTLKAWHDPRTKQVHVFAAEMNAGGWNTPYNGCSPLRFRDNLCCLTGLSAISTLNM